MPNIVEITDLSAPELDVYARLTQAQLRNRLEPDKGIFIAESPKVITRALDAGYTPLSLLMERKQITGPAADLLTRCGDAPVYTADRETLASLTGFVLTRGVLCAFRRPLPRSVEEVCRNARRVAVLEGIVDSTNVGAIFRSAAALNIDAVLVTPSCCDPLCRRAVRVSMGTVFQVPWAQIGTCPADWPENGIAQLHSLGFKTAAMALSDRSVSIDDSALSAEPKLAIVLGTEGEESDADGIQQRYAAVLQRFLSLLMENYCKKHTVAFYAERMNYTPQYLTEIVKRQTGRTVNDFIFEMLYCEARNLLSVSDASVQQIADELNFSDQAAFSKFFKRRSGMSPLEFRKINKAKTAGE